MSKVGFVAPLVLLVLGACGKQAIEVLKLRFLMDLGMEF